jgi:hypothetical protein
LSAASFGGAGDDVAIDVGVACPTAADALRHPEKDVLDEYRIDKLTRRGDVCRQAGWVYTPFIISTFGRAHPDAVKVVHKLAQAASRKYGCADARRTESSWWRNAASLLAERAARMVRKCSPAEDRDVPAIVSGVNEAKTGLVLFRARRSRAARDSDPVVRGQEASAPTGV